jgi:hypothetical protein
VTEFSTARRPGVLLRVSAERAAAQRRDDRPGLIGRPEGERPGHKALGMRGAEIPVGIAGWNILRQLGGG